MPLLPSSSLLRSILVVMEPQTGTQRAFAVKAFYKNGESFVIAQCEFRREFGINRNPAVPTANAKNFEATGSTLKKKDGSVKKHVDPRTVFESGNQMGNTRTTFLTEKHLTCTLFSALKSTVIV